MGFKEGATLDRRDYLCYALLEELESRQPDGRSITRTQFLKLACIADRKLTNVHNIDLELPRYWYKYGEILNTQLINDGLYNENQGEWGGIKIQRAPGTSTDDFDIESSIRTTIREVTRSLAHDFATAESEHIKQHQYENYAPNEFIQSFDQFRDHLKNQRIEDHSLSDFETVNQSPSETATDFLDEVFLQYPADQYSEMYNLFLRWEDTTRMLLDDQHLEEAKQLAQNFWEAISKVELRIHHEQHTPREQKMRWIDDREQTMQTFEDQLNNVREKVLSKQQPSGVLETVVQPSSSDSV